MFAKNWKCVVSLAVLALSLAFATTGSAATITSSVQNSSSKIVFDNTYPLVGAAMIGTDAISYPNTYDGIAFEMLPYNLQTTAWTLPSGVTVGSADNREFTTGYRNNVGGTGQYLFRGHCDSNMPVRLLFDGLDAGETYVFQFGYYSTGTGYTQDAWLAAETSGLPDYGHLPIAQAQFLEYGTGTHATGYEYAKLNATVSDTTEFSIQMERGNQSMNAFSVHVVPEPATLILLAAGLPLMLRRRRS